MSTERIQVEGEGHAITLADGVVPAAGIVVRGGRNTLTIGADTTVAGYVLSGPTGPLATISGDDPCLVIEGEDNVVEIAAGCRLNLSMAVTGNGNRIHIGVGCRLNGLVNIPASGAILSIGDGVTMVRGSIQMHEAASISIGRDCMISSDVYLSVSDIHPIHDAATGVRINPAASITIGDHVWLGLRSMVMKGAAIGDGAVIAAGAIVSGGMEADSIAAGVPARVLRRGIVWRRDLTDI